MSLQPISTGTTGGFRGVQSITAPIVMMEIERQAPNVAQPQDGE